MLLSEFDQKSFAMSTNKQPLLPVLFVELGNQDADFSFRAHILRAARGTTAVVGCSHGPLKATENNLEVFDAVADLDASTPRSIACIVTTVWRQRLADSLALMLQGPAVTKTLHQFKQDGPTPRSVKELANSLRQTREHFSRQIAHDCAGTGLNAKVLADLMLVMDFLVLRSLGFTGSQCAGMCSVSYPTCVRALHRLKQLLPQPIDNFRLFQLHVESYLVHRIATRTRS